MSDEWKERVYKPKMENDFPENWNEIRSAVIIRYSSRCYRCDKKFAKKNLQVHHILPRSDGGGNNLSNLLPLCLDCHDYVEIKRLKTKAEIIGSYKDASVIVEENKNGIDKDESFSRPSWHKHVYGGESKVW